jgi:hypothetical protein
MSTVCEAPGSDPQHHKTKRKNTSVTGENIRKRQEMKTGRMTK